jgi:hypothetical protein
MMAFLAGLAGFAIGFLLGQALLLHLLQGRTRQEITELMKDKKSRIKYGLINWLMAFAGMALSSWAYVSWAGR